MRLDLNDTVLVIKHGKKSADHTMIDMIQTIANLRNISKTEARRLIVRGGVHIYWRKMEKHEEES